MGSVEHDQTNPARQIGKGMKNTQGEERVLTCKRAEMLDAQCNNSQTVQTSLMN